MKARRFFGSLSRLLSFGLASLLPLMFVSVELGRFVQSYGLWLPSAGVAVAMLVTGIWAPLVARALFKKYRLIDLLIVWVFGLMVGGLYWAKDYGPRLTVPQVTAWDVLTSAAVVMASTTCLVFGSWIGVLLFAGGKDTWRAWMRRVSNHDWGYLDEV